MGQMTLIYLSGGSLPLILMHTRALKTSGGALPSYILHTRAFGAYLLGGYLPCKKEYKVMVIHK